LVDTKTWGQTRLRLPLRGIMFLNHYGRDIFNQLLMLIQKSINMIKKDMTKGERAAMEAERNWIQQFQNKGVPDDLEKVLIDDKICILDLLVKVGFTKSKSEARRKIDEGAVKIDDEKIKEHKYEVELSNTKDPIIKLGRKMIKIVKKN